MGVNPDMGEQQRIAAALERQGERLSPEERRAELFVGGAFVVAVAALIAAFPPALEGWDPAPALACAATLVVALRAGFDLGSGFTVPSQVAFVPLLFSAPPSLVPIVVVLALGLALLPDVARGELRAVRLLRSFANAWFSVGPALVLAAASVDGPADAAPLVLAGALAAQLAGDFAASAVMEALVNGAGLREQLRDAWVYAVDVALTPIGLVIAWHVGEEPWAVVAAIPLLMVLAVFGQERRGRVEGLVELNRAYRGTARLLSHVIEGDDAYTGEHSRGVVELALDAGRALGLSADRMRNLEFGALLHDVGKVAIPKEILNKPGKLDADEWELMKSHTVEGQRMLDEIGGFMSDVGRIVRSHHERWDGGGYPDGIAGEAIPVEARIVTVCDAWSAMTTTRPYRAALPRAEAVRELRRCAGSQFDPAVVAALLDAVRDADPPHRLEAPTAALR